MNFKISILLTLLITLILEGNVFAQSTYEPDFSMSLEAFEAQVLDEKEEIWIVDFWATWCGPCIQSIPELKELHSKWASKGVRLISISWDRNEGKWRRGLDRFRMPWQHIIVPKGKEAFLDKHFPHKGIPTIFIVNREGKIKKIKDSTGIDRTIEKALK